MSALFTLCVEASRVVADKYDDVGGLAVTLLKSWSLHTCARIAQGIERLPPEQKAVGSIPTAGTTLVYLSTCANYLSGLFVQAACCT